jgi:hypothetical protein
MTAASNALELQHARYLIDKGLRVALRRIDPTTKAFVSEMYYSSAQRLKRTPSTARLLVCMEIRMIAAGR